MQRLNGRVIEADRDGLRVGQGELQLAGQTIDTHGKHPHHVGMAGALNRPWRRLARCTLDEADC
ncbi:hypothetical protein D3C77_787650 [compost metagenome]